MYRARRRGVLRTCVHMPSVLPFCGWCALGRLGFIMMLIGILLIVVFVPYWMWPAVLGVALTVLGFLLWKVF